MAGKAVMVHSLEQARAAVAAAAGLGVPVTLLSAEGAAGSVGALWFKALIEQAVAGQPEAEVTAVLDCADKPGHVLGALRHGFTALRFTGRPKVRKELEKVAAAYGATLITSKIAAVDLLEEPDPEAACRAWLAAGNRAKSGAK